MKGAWNPFYFMTKEGRELEPRELIKEWLDILLGDFKEEQHCLYSLTHKSLANIHTKNTTNTPQLPPISQLQQEVEALIHYTPYIDYQVNWTACYHRYASYLKYLLNREQAKTLGELELWEYQKVLLEYLRKAQQQNPQDTKIALEITNLLHLNSPVAIVAQDYAQEVIDNYLMATFVPDPTVPLSQYSASWSYVGLANFYRDILQQALSAHHYYEKSLALAPSNDQAKIEWATLLEQEGATAKATALLATVDPAYEQPINF